MGWLRRALEGSTLVCVHTAQQPPSEGEAEAGAGLRGQGHGWCGEGGRVVRGQGMHRGRAWKGPGAVQSLQATIRAETLLPNKVRVCVR